MNFTIERKTITAQPRQLTGTWTVSRSPDISMIQKMNYRQLLSHLHHNRMTYTNLPMSEQDDKEKEVMDTIQEIMQSNFPGPYVVEEYYDSKNMKFALRLKFKSPQEETMWTIKNS